MTSVPHSPRCRSVANGLGALALGNFVTAAGVLMPAAMLTALSESFHLAGSSAGGLLILSGLVIGLGAPVLASLTSRIDRRRLLTVVLLIGAAGHLASALSPSFAALMAARVAIAVAAALFSPQAAAAVTLLVAPPQREASIALIFIGWSLAMIIGLPACGLLTAGLGWPSAHLVLCGLSVTAACLLWLTLPPELHPEPLSRTAWARAFQNPVILSLLGVTFLSLAGQFAIFSFLPPLLARLFGAGTRETAAVFALAGLSGVAGNVVVARLAVRLSAERLILATLAMMAAGATLLGVAAGSRPLGIIAVGIWGLGSFASTSLQQGRLASAAPEIAAATISLNTSTVYLGQAAGVAAGGAAFASGVPERVVWSAVAFLLAAMAVSAAVTRLTAKPDGMMRWAP